MSAPAATGTTTTQAVSSHFTRVVYADLETSGLSATTECLIEIGAACDAERFQTLVALEPGRRIAPAAQKVHGISESELRDAPAFPVAWASFVAWLDKTRGTHERVVCIFHNGFRFDCQFLEAALRRHKLTRPTWLKWADSLPAVRALWPHLKSHALATLATAPINHRALGDAEALQGVCTTDVVAAALKDVR